MTQNREIIKDEYNRVIGFIETDQYGNKRARDFYGRVKGTYNVQTKLTKDFYGRVVSRGDTTIGLLYRK